MKNVLNLCKCNVQGGAEYSSQVIYDGGSVDCIPDLVGENLSVVLERIGEFVCGLGIQMITTNEFEPSNEFGKNGDIHIREQEESIDLYQKLNGEWTLVGSFPIGGGGGGVGDFVTINTDQFGLTGTKEWQGRHYFENALAIPREAPTDPLPGKAYIYVGPGTSAIPPEAFGNLEDLQNVASPIPVNKFLYKGSDGIWVGVDVPGQDLSAYASKVWVGDNFYSKEISDGLFVTQATDQFDMPGNKGWTGRHHFDGSLAIPQAAPIAPDPTKAYIYVGAGSGATPPSGMGNLEDLQNVDDVIANNKFLYKGTDGIWVGVDGPTSQLYQPAIGQVGIIGGNTINLNTVNTSGNQTGIAGDKTWTGGHSFVTNQINVGDEATGAGYVRFLLGGVAKGFVGKDFANNDNIRLYNNTSGQFISLNGDGSTRITSLSGTGNGIVGANAVGTLERRGIIGSDLGIISNNVVPFWNGTEWTTGRSATETVFNGSIPLRTGTGQVKFSDGVASNDGVTLGQADNRYTRQAALGGSMNTVRVGTSSSIEGPLPGSQLGSGVSFDFKLSSIIGISGFGAYSSVITMAPWVDNSGNNPAAFRLLYSAGVDKVGLFIQQYRNDEWKKPIELLHHGNAPDLAPGMILERFRDPSFKFGDNNITAYPNNTGTAISRITDSTSPTGMSMRYTATGWAQANVRITFAGMGTLSSPGKVFITRMIAKVPVGWKIQDQHNSGGTGAVAEWLTDNAGTGAFKEYLFKYTCGVGGSFSLVNYFDLRKVSAATPNPSSANPVVSYLAFAVVTDQTESAINTRLRIPTTAPEYPLPGDVWVL